MINPPNPSDLQVHLLLPAEIDAHALPRDRTGLDPEALTELETSILLTGLRQPIEVFAIDLPGDAPPEAPRYGLVSGLRRLTAFARIHRDSPEARIPAFLRTPADIPDAMARMVAENEIRAEISPWEKGRIAVEAVDLGLFDTLDAAVARLYAGLDRHRRTRIRAIAEVVTEIGDRRLTNPETLSQNQLARLAAALRQGYGDLIDHALRHSTERSPDGQWRLILSILEEAEAEARTPTLTYRPGRPRRIAHPRIGLWIRRERTPEGWSLHFTGPEATGPLMEDIMDHVEQQFGK